MRIVLIGHDFDFSTGDGISRYSYELYNGLQQYVEVKAIATGRLPRPMRALFNIKVRDSDIVHLMYPDAARVEKGSAKMVTTWHDLRPFTKYLDQGQYKSMPKFVERFDIANSIIKKWVMENYHASDALLFNSSQTKKELKDYFSSTRSYDPRKVYAITPLGVDSDFLNAKIWKGKRSDFAYLGSIHHRHKNLEGLLRIFDKIAEKSGANLHIFTFSPKASDLLREEMKKFKHISNSNVFLHLGVPDKEVARYIPKLSAYLQLTKHEGQGLPIFASLAMGTNVLTLKESELPNEARKYTISGSEDAIVKKALELTKASKPAPQKAIAYARSFTWERTVRETLAVYKKLL